MSRIKWPVFFWSCLVGILFFYYSANSFSLRDPTQPVITPLNPSFSSTEDKFNLQSIVIGPQRHLAMINGQIVGAGSTIQGARVLVIGKNHVVLLQDKRKITLYLFGKHLWKKD